MLMSLRGNQLTNQRENMGEDLPEVQVHVP
jgi:hypothetical protein